MLYVYSINDLHSQLKHLEINNNCENDDYNLYLS